MLTNSCAAFCCTCCHAGSFAFAILDSWPAAAVAHWFHCASACSRRLRPPRRRLPLTPTRRFPSGIVRCVAAQWLWSSASPLFRSRFDLHLRLTPDMQSSVRDRSPNASAGARYRCASNSALLRWARPPQSYPVLSRRSLASFQQQPTPVNPSRYQPLAKHCSLRRFHSPAILIQTA